MPRWTKGWGCLGVECSGFAVFCFVAKWREGIGGLAARLDAIDFRAVQDWFRLGRAD